MSFEHVINTIKFGGDVIHAHNGGNSKEFGGPIYLGQFKYLPVRDLAHADSFRVRKRFHYLENINNVQTYTQSYGNADYTADDTLWSVFMQDDYRLRRILS